MNSINTHQIFMANPSQIEFRKSNNVTDNPHKYSKEQEVEDKQVATATKYMIGATILASVIAAGLAARQGAFGEKIQKIFKSSKELKAEAEKKAKEAKEKAEKKVKEEMENARSTNSSNTTRTNTRRHSNNSSNSGNTNRTRSTGSQGNTNRTNGTGSTGSQGNTNRTNGTGGTGNQGNTNRTNGAGGTGNQGNTNRTNGTGSAGRTGATGQANNARARWQTGTNTYSDSFLNEFDSISNAFDKKTSSSRTTNITNLKTEIQGLAQLLGISPLDIINKDKSVKKKLMLKFHPDRNPDDKVAEKMFKMINTLFSL